MLLPDKVTVLLLLLIRPPAPEILPARFRLMRTVLVLEATTTLVRASKITVVPVSRTMLLANVRTCGVFVVSGTARRVFVACARPPALLVKTNDPEPMALSLPRPKITLVRTTVPPA